MNPSIYIQSGGLVTIFNKIRWYQSLKWKLFFICLLVSFLPVLFFANTISRHLKSDFMSTRTSELTRKANIVGDRISRENFLFDPTKEDEFALDMYERSLEESLRIIVTDTRAVVINDTSGIENGNTFIAPEVMEALQESASSNIQDDGATKYTAAPIFNESSEVVGVVLLVSSIQDINDLLESIQTISRWLNLATAGFVLVAVFFISQIILVPLERLLKVVQKMSEGHLGQRVAVTGNDEFAQLCEAFNDMNDKLERVENTREEFVSNVSHELKTPLSSIKVLCESILFEENVPEEMYREFLQDINSEIDRMNNIVNDLLTLVKLDQTVVGLNIQETNINKIIERIIKVLNPLALKKDIELSTEYIKNINLQADGMKLSLAISNLIENSIKYTPNGGKVKVTIDADHQNVFVTVQDTGIGIDEEEQSKIFTRFYRVDKTRDRGTGGTGLGLSITHSTILLHSGSIRVSSKEGKGTTFVVRLPINYSS